MQAHELKIGQACRYGTDKFSSVGCVRVKSEGNKVALITADYDLLLVEPHEQVYSAFGWEGPEPPESDRRTVTHIKECISRVNCMWHLSSVNQEWQERMKDLAAERLKPESDETITDLEALDHIWDLRGDYVISGDQVYHARALDYYLGRKVEHICGIGILMKIAKEYGDERLPKEREYFGPERVWLSNMESKYSLVKRGIHYGIRLDYPCRCGKVKYEMFAIPGVHSGAFAYLVGEDSPNYLDLRNHERVCEECK